MYSKTLPSRQLATWLSAALIPVLLQLSVGDGWPAVSVAVIVGTVATITVWKWGKVPAHPIIAVLQILYILVLLMQLLPSIAFSWPGDNYPVVPLIVLALAAWSANKGASAAARVGCVLFWIVLIMYLIVLATATKEITFSWLRPDAFSFPWMSLAVILLPCAGIVMRCDESKWDPRVLLPGVLLLAGTCVTAGVLSPERVRELSDPFYIMSRSVNLLGIAQRFEAVLSAGMTVGWYSLVSATLSISAAWAEKVGAGLASGAVWGTAAAAAVGMLCNLHISWQVLAIFASVFWVGIPILTQGLVRTKKS